MPVSRHSIRNEGPPASLTMPWGDEEIKVSYQPEAITPAWRKRLRSEPIRNCLAEVLVSWDVTETEESENAWVPPAELREDAATFRAAWLDILEQLGNVFINRLLNAIIDDFVGGK